MLDRYPAPNVFRPAANNYRRVGTDTTAQDQFDVRLDHTSARATAFSARYSYLRDDSKPGHAAPGRQRQHSPPTLHRQDFDPRRQRRRRAQLDRSPLASVNQLRFGFTRRSFDRSVAGHRPAGRHRSRRSRTFRATSFCDVLPTYDIVGLQQLGPPANGNADFTTSVTQFIDNFSWISGPHSLKAGTDIRLERLDVLQPPSPTGNFQFTHIFTAADRAGTPARTPATASRRFLARPGTRFSIDAQSRVAEAAGQDRRVLSAG